MQERKKVVASISLFVFAGRVVFSWIGRGTKLQDDEFDMALTRARETGIYDIEDIIAYPFSPVTRADAAQRYVLLAQDIGLVPSGTTEDCLFEDITDFDQQIQNILILSCQYEFFKGTDNHFYPHEYVTKANSLVGLMRGLYPDRDFSLEQPYRTSYVNFAHRLGITKRSSGPYLMYLITKYELLLQLWRVYQLKHHF